MSQSFATPGENAKTHTVLIVDKEGLYGLPLALKIEASATVVFVSSKKPDDSHIIHVPFTKRVPEMPDGVYSHIFCVEESESQIQSELLIPLAQKAKEDSAKFIYVLPYGLYAEELQEKLASACGAWAMVLMGDVFGPDVYDSLIGAIFQQTKKQKSIRLSDLGLETIRPVALSDAIDALKRIGFGSEKDQIFLAFPRHSYTALSVVHSLQKIDPDIKIDFVNDTSAYALSQALPTGLYLFESTYPTTKKLQEAYVSFEEVEKFSGKSMQSPISFGSVRKKQPGKSIFIFSLVFSLLLLILLPLIWTTAILGLGGGFLQQAKEQVAAGNISKASTFVRASTILFEWGKGGSSIVTLEAKLIGKPQDGLMLENTLTSLHQFSQAIGYVLLGAQDFQAVEKEKPLSPIATFTDGTNAIKNALLLFESLQMAYLPKNVQQELQDLAPTFHVVGQTIDVASHLFAFDHQKTYLILFQNNTELRPGGGFIGSYGVVKINKGKVIDFQIHDVYDADGQLKGHVEPPFAIRRYIPLVHWYLRDSNFSADFQKNAQNAAFFLQQETGERADGVIAGDLSFVEGIVQALGKVYVPQYKQTVTADNFFLLVETHAEKNSFAGSTQKKDFLSSLFSAIQGQLIASRVSYPLLLQKTTSALTQKHLMLAFADPSIQQVFTVNGFSSSLWDGRKAQDNTLNDFTAINEANIGINKVNAYIKRQVSQVATISSSGNVSEVLKIIYNNTNNGSWPGGVYRNYLRIFLPNGALLTNISLNGKPQSRYPAVIDPKIYEAPKFKAPDGLEIEEAQEGGRTAYGFLVQVGVSSTLTVEVSYTLSQKFDLTKQSYTYDGVFFKQPGTDAYPYIFSLQYPVGFTLVKKPFGTTTSMQEGIVDASLNTDKEYVFTFAKQ